MSVKQFEEFIAEYFVGWARANAQTGFRYQFRLSSTDNSLRLYRSLTSDQYKDGNISCQGLELPYVQCGDTKLLTVIHNDDEGFGFSENFISFLRDEVASQSGNFTATSLLVIHNSLLDTLVNSAEDLTKEDCVLSPGEIKKALEELIDIESDEQTKSLSKILLNYQFDVVTEDQGSLFGFSALYTAISDGKIEFQEIGLLPDPAVETMNADSVAGEKQVRKRLDENRKLYEEIEGILEHYPDQLSGNLPEISDSFIKKNFSDDEKTDWKNLTYDEYLKEQEKNRVQNLELSNEASTSGSIVARAKGSSKSAQKIRHIILEVENDLDNFEFTFEFTGSRIKKEKVSVIDKSNLNPITADNIRVTGGTKLTKLSVEGVVTEVPKFFCIRLRRAKASEKFVFNCLVVKKGIFNCEAIRNNFLIIPHKEKVCLQTQDTMLEISNTGCNKIASVKEVGQVFDIDSQDVLDFTDLSNNVETINFVVQNGVSRLEFDIEGAAATDFISLPLLLDQSVKNNLFKNGYFGIYNSDSNRVFIDNNEMKGTARTKAFLSYEHTLIDENFLSYSDDVSKQLTIDDIATLAPKLATAYAELFDYYRKNSSLPSIAGWDSEYCSLVNEVVKQYHNYLSDIPLKGYLDIEHSRVVGLGMSTFDGCEYFTPIHPLVLAYYSQLVKYSLKDDTRGFQTLPDVTLDRLTPQGLIPFIYDSTHEFSYVKSEEEDCFWMHCVPYKDTNYGYVVKLVNNKIEEFSEAFKSLFISHGSPNSRPTLIINSINNNVNEELFLGIVSYVIKRGNDALSIHVNIYDDDFSETEFDLFAQISNYDQIKARYKLNIGAAKNDSDTIVDILRTRVTYSKFTNSSSQAQKYSHLTFFRNNQKVKVVAVDPLEQLSGISCHGLINGEASASKQNNYITGFGLEGVDQSGLIHLDIANMLNRLVWPARDSTCEYRNTSAIALAVDNEFRNTLEKSYENSIWTTVIDPKVTLDFFKNSENMLLIHYSDQYTSSASYDAITVTRQTELYDQVLAKEDGGLIGEFNAFNGEWLLQMVSAPATIRKERQGIIAAYKLVSCLLSMSDITWIPVSVGELVRVSGNIGLSKVGSEFSRHVHNYTKGAISDDILFVGVKDDALYLLPVEVKAGFGYDAKKALKQAKELGRYLSQDVLSGEGLDRILYRGLFIRQVLMQIDKYQLYSVYPDNYFEKFLNEKERWLKGDYHLASISNYPSGFVVAHLENDKCLETKAEEIDGILKIEVPFSFIPHTVSTPLQVLMSDRSKTAVAGLSDQYFLEMSRPEELVFDEKVVINEDLDDVDDPDDNNIEDLDDEGIAQQNSSGAYEERGNSEPLTVDEGAKSLKVLVGHDVKHNEAVYWEPTNTAKFMNTNSGIIGTMGTGKTQCTKSVVTQLYRNQHLNVDGKPIGILIFDYKSDYVDDKFTNATGAKKYNLHKLPYNPMSLFGDTPMLPVHTARGFSETMGKAFGLGQKQLLRLRQLILECYELAGISRSDASTWSKPAPTISDLWSLFIDQEKVEEDSLYAALESLYDLQIFEDDHSKCTSLYELIDGVTVIELAKYPSQIQNLVVALTLDLFYSQMQKQGKPEVHGDFRQVTKLILVDEADNFMSQDFPSLRKVLKEGREYGVGVILSTQDITHFKTRENDYSVYILSWVIHRVSQIKNQDIKALFNKDNKSEQEDTMNAIRNLEKHHSLYVDGSKRIQKIKDKAFWELMET